VGRTRDMNRAEREVLLRGLDDYVGLWEVFSVTRRELPETDGSSIRRAVMEVVSNLLEKGLMRAGFPTRGGGFDPSDETPEETLTRIEHEWDRLGREPDVGDIVWFDLTEEGEARARDLARAR
jgi:hypothetical protein